MAFIRAASMRDVSSGQVQVVEVEDEEIVLCNVQGTIYAIANLCTHDDGPVGEGELIGHEIECPRHGARFDVRNGEARSLPAVVAIPTYPVQIAGDEILVDVE
jgi:3-phenylpropionate/trans-cinnamate dioxygenase ferredoxin subunit